MGTRAYLFSVMAGGSKRQDDDSVEEEEEEDEGAEGKSRARAAAALVSGESGDEVARRRPCSTRSLKSMSFIRMAPSALMSNGCTATPTYLK
jgi:hypothetical protein